jgi:hypothetical protein
MFKIIKNNILIISYFFISLYVSCDCPREETAYIMNNTKDTVIIKTCQMKSGHRKLFKSRQDSLREEEGVVRKLFSATKGETDTCNNCFSLKLFPGEKIEIVSSRLSELKRVFWGFNHLEIILPNGKIIADDNGIPVLFGMNREDCPNNYTYFLE